MDVDEVELPEIETVDLRVDGIVKCAEWTSDHFEYVVVNTLFTDRFFYKFKENSILVRDLFTGDLRTFTPAESVGTMQLQSLGRITNSRLFVIYQIDLGSNVFEFQIGIIAFDYESSTYNFVCKSQSLFSHRYLQNYWWFYFHHAGENLIGTRLRYMPSRPTDLKCEKELEKLCLWNINQNASNFELQTVIDIDKDGKWMNIIDGTLFYTKKVENDQASGFGVRYIVKVDANTPPTILENSRIHFDDHPKIERKRREERTQSLLENWYKDNLFVLSGSRIYVDGIRTVAEYILYSFNVRECGWTKVFLNIPPVKSNVFFYRVVDGIMTIFDEKDDNVNNRVKDKNTTVYAATYRLPVDKPDKLLNLACFKVKECKLGTSIAVVEKILTEF